MYRDPSYINWLPVVIVDALLNFIFPYYVAAALGLGARMKNGFWSDFFHFQWRYHNYLRLGKLEK